MNIVKNIKNIKVHSLPRTGSTLCMRLFDQHPKILASSETSFNQKRELDYHIEKHNVDYIASKVIYFPKASDYLYNVFSDIDKEIFLFRRNVIDQMNSMVLLRTQNPGAYNNAAGQQVRPNLARRQRVPRSLEVKASQILDTIDQQILAYSRIVEAFKTRGKKTMVIDYETMIESPSGTINQIFEFLNIERIPEFTELKDYKAGEFKGDPRARESSKIGIPREKNEDLNQIIRDSMNIEEVKASLPKNGIYEPVGLEKSRLKKAMGVMESIDKELEKEKEIIPNTPIK